MGASESTLGAAMTKTERDRVKRRFERMTGKSGTISLEEFIRASNLPSNIFVHRIFMHFDKDKDGRISADDFVTALDSLGRMYSEEEKVRWMFGLYDSDKDGKLSHEDLSGIWQHTNSGQNMNQEQMHAVISSILKEYDADGDGLLSFPEFRHLAAAAGPDARPFMGKAALP